MEFIVWMQLNGNELMPMYLTMAGSAEPIDNLNVKLHRINKTIIPYINNLFTC